MLELVVAVVTVFGGTAVFLLAFKAFDKFSDWLDRW